MLKFVISEGQIGHKYMFKIIKLVPPIQLYPSITFSMLGFLLLKFFFMLDTLIRRIRIIGPGARELTTPATS